VQCYLTSVQAKVTKECPVCGTHFEVFKNRKCYVKQFCSYRCAIKSREGTHRKQPIVIECLFCGKVFSIFPSRRNTAKFCSKECHDSWQRRNEVKHKCKNCGRVFYTSPSLRNHVFCSKSCHNEYVGMTEWDNRKVIQQIELMQQRREPLNAVYCRDNRLDLFKASIKRFGSWTAALKASGIESEKVRLDRKTSSYKGPIFEKIVEQLYRLSDITVRRKPHVGRCQPDFIEENTGIWVDAKLRSWTVGIEKTISKYIEHADTIQIIYLGGGSREYLNSEGVTFVSVYDKFPIIGKLQSSHKIRTSLNELEKQDIRDERFKTWSETWSRERIVAQIKQIVTSGESINRSGLQTNHPRLSSAITSRRYFPDYASAVKAAGFDPLKYTRRRTHVYQTYEEAKKAARTLGIRYRTDYQKRYKEDTKLPSKPKETYRNKGWENWADFLRQ
jgi:endogenous inhibitor of DNA gyrase (YacG/DUF329 family)